MARLAPVASRRLGATLVTLVALVAAPRPAEASPDDTPSTIELRYVVAQRHRRLLLGGRVSRRRSGPPRGPLLRRAEAHGRRDDHHARRGAAARHRDAARGWRLTRVGRGDEGDLRRARRMRDPERGRSARGQPRNRTRSQSGRPAATRSATRSAARGRPRRRPSRSLRRSHHELLGPSLQGHGLQPLRPQPAPYELRTHASLTGEYGILPGPSIGESVGASLRIGGWSAGLEAGAWLPASVSSSASRAGARAWLHFLSGSACAERSHLFVCGVGTLGEFRASGTGRLLSRSSGSTYVALGARVGTEIPLVGPFSLAVHGSVLTPLLRPTLRIGDALLWRAPIAGGELGIGLRMSIL